MDNNVVTLPKVHLIHHLLRGYIYGFVVTLVVLTLYLPPSLALITTPTRSSISSTRTANNISNQPIVFWKMRKAIKSSPMNVISRRNNKSNRRNISLNMYQRFGTFGHINNNMIRKNIISNPLLNSSLHRQNHDRFFSPYNRRCYSSLKDGIVDDQIENDNINNDDDDISFEFKSFDKEGQWKVLNWKEIMSIQRHEQQDDINTSKLNNDKYYSITSMDQLQSKTVYPLQPSPVELSLIRDRMVYIKRDDFLHLRQSNVSGNKARKMYALNELPATTATESSDSRTERGDVSFPDAIVSYGGPQSNAMLALAAIVHSKNEEIEPSKSDEQSTISNPKNNINDSTTTSSSFFSIQSQKKRKKRLVYYTKKLPRYLRKQPNGNLLRALSLGMELVELPHERYKQLFGEDDGGSAIPPQHIDPPIPYNSVWIPQGGSNGLAVWGVQMLAEEIVQFWSKNGRGLPLSVCVPGGTCTTAMFLSREINSIIQQRQEENEGEALDIKVVVIPCVGDDKYALKQMKALDISTGGNGQDDIPTILKPLERRKGKGNGYFTFGEPSSDILETFSEMRDEYSIYLDLLYGSPAWNLMFQHWKVSITDSDTFDEYPIAGRQIMYVHSGGLEGVSSQLTRYKHKGLISSNEIQN